MPASPSSAIPPRLHIEKDYSPRRPQPLDLPSPVLMQGGDNELGNAGLSKSKKRLLSGLIKRRLLNPFTLLGVLVALLLLGWWNSASGRRTRGVTDDGIPIPTKRVVCPFFVSRHPREGLIMRPCYFIFCPTAPGVHAESTAIYRTTIFHNITRRPPTVQVYQLGDMGKWKSRSCSCELRCDRHQVRSLAGGAYQPGARHVHV